MYLLCHKYCTLDDFLHVMQGYSDFIQNTGGNGKIIIINSIKGLFVHVSLLISGLSSLYTYNAKWQFHQRKPVISVLSIRIMND